MGVAGVAGHGRTRYRRSLALARKGSLSELTEAWRLGGIGGFTGTSTVVNGVIFFGDWHGAVHLLERHFPVRARQADSLAAKR